MTIEVKLLNKSVRMGGLKTLLTLTFTIALASSEESSDHCKIGIRYQVFPPSPLYFGRGEFLAKLQISIQRSKSQHLTPTSLHPSHDTHIIKFITGKEAIGKTELVKKYIEKYGDHYTHVLYFNAASQNILVTSFLDLSMQDHFTSTANHTSQEESNQNSDSPDIFAIVQEIYGKLSHDSTLIVFDHLPFNRKEDGGKTNLILPFLPSLTSFPHFRPVILVIAPKFDVSWGQMVDELEVFPLESFTPYERTEFVIKKMGIDDYDRKEFAGVDSKFLGDLLRGLPTAFHLAVTYMKSTGVSIKTYTEIMVSQQENVEEEDQVIRTAWSMTRNEVEEMSGGDYAIELIQVLAILGIYDEIPEDFLYALTPSFDFGGKLDEKYFVRTLSNMEHYGLLNRNVSDGQNVVNCYKPILRMVREGLDKQKKQVVVERAQGFLREILNEAGMDRKNFRVTSKALRCLEKFAISLFEGGTGKERGESLAMLGMILDVQEKVKEAVQVRSTELVVKYLKMKMAEGEEEDKKKWSQRDRIEL